MLLWLFCVVKWPWVRKGLDMLANILGERMLNVCVLQSNVQSYDSLKNLPDVIQLRKFRCNCRLADMQYSGFSAKL